MSTGTWAISFELMDRDDRCSLIMTAREEIRRYATVTGESIGGNGTFYVTATSQEHLEQAVMWTSMEIGRAVVMYEIEPPRRPWWRRSRR